MDNFKTHDKDGQVELQIKSIEQGKFTTVFEITLAPLGRIKVLEKSVMKVRVYFDAKVAEVISFQNHQRLQPYYEYPNKAMYQRDEKRQTNLLFRDMLVFCSARGFSPFSLITKS
jgi:uncharacterized protein YqiB (DUF1249 family)